MKPSLYFFKGEKERSQVTAMRVQLEQKYADYTTLAPTEATHMVVVGGDGTFLEAERFLGATKMSAKLVGIACGTANNLMNKTNDLLRLIRTAPTIEFHPFTVACLCQDGKAHIRHAYNEVVLHRCSPYNQSCHLYVEIGQGKQQVVGETQGDGLIVATRQGYSGYFENAGGKFIDIWSANVGTQPICDKKAERLSRVFPENQRIVIHVQDADKRPVIINADNTRAIKNVIHCEIQTDTSRVVPVVLGRQTPIMRLNYRKMQTLEQARA